MVTQEQLVVGQRYRIVALGEDDAFYDYTTDLAGVEAEYTGWHEEGPYLHLSRELMQAIGFAEHYSEEELDQGQDILFLASITLEPVIKPLNEKEALEDAWASYLDQVEQWDLIGINISVEKLEGEFVKPGFEAGWHAALAWLKNHPV